MSSFLLNLDVQEHVDHELITPKIPGTIIVDAEANPIVSIKPVYWQYIEDNQSIFGIFQDTVSQDFVIVIKSTYSDLTEFHAPEKQTITGTKAMLKFRHKEYSFNLLV